MKRVLVVWCLWLCLTGFAAAEGPQLTSSQRGAIDAAVTAFMSANSVPGVSVAVVLEGQPVWATGYGLADVENNVPATAQTMYRLASVSKTVTATAVMQLAEKGKLNLDAPVQRYCPAFPDKGQPITTRQLLSHMAGIRHYRQESIDDPDVSSTRHYASTNEALKTFAADPLVDTPGKHFHYSTFGYTLLGCAIEGASGMSYEAYVRQHILAQAGMTSTQVDDVRAIIPHRAQGYQKIEGKLANSDLADTSYKVPGGGWISSAEDMARYEAALLNYGLVSAATRQAMWTSQKDADGKDIRYGLGWRFWSVAGAAFVGHTGSQQRVTTVIAMVPEKKAGVVVLTNFENARPLDLANDLLKLLVGTNVASTAK